MSDAPSPPQPPESLPSSEAAQAPAPPARKRRSPIERGIVWSVIGVLLIVMGVEAWAHWGFTSAYGPLAEKVRQADNSDVEVFAADVQKAVRGKKPERVERIRGITRTADREEKYVWHGILKDRVMYVYYGVGEDPAVLFVSTEREPPPAALSEEFAAQMGVSAEPPASELIESNE